jgi:hypothetical protein
MKYGAEKRPQAVSCTDRIDQTYLKMGGVRDISSHCGLIALDHITGPGPLTVYAGGVSRRRKISGHCSTTRKRLVRPSMKWRRYESLKGREKQNEVQQIFEIRVHQPRNVQDKYVKD